jgi:hypothetical protein
MAHDRAPIPANAFDDLESLLLKRLRGPFIDVDEADLRRMRKSLMRRLLKVGVPSPRAQRRNTSSRQSCHARGHK